MTLHHSERLPTIDTQIDKGNKIHRQTQGSQRQKETLRLQGLVSHKAWGNKKALVWLNKSTKF